MRKLSKVNKNQEIKNLPERDKLIVEENLLVKEYVSNLKDNIKTHGIVNIPIIGKLKDDYYLLDGKYSYEYLKNEDNKKEFIPVLLEEFESYEDLFLSFACLQKEKFNFNFLSFFYFLKDIDPKKVKERLYFDDEDILDISKTNRKNFGRFESKVVFFKNQLRKLF